VKHKNVHDQSTNSLLYFAKLKMFGPYAFMKKVIKSHHSLLINNKLVLHNNCKFYFLSHYYTTLKTHTMQSMGCSIPWYLASSTLIILFSKMLKFSKIISSNPKNIVKENNEYLRIFHLLK